jgi:hypothetical protein
LDFRSSSFFLEPAGGLGFYPDFRAFGRASQTNGSSESFARPHCSGRPPGWKRDLGFVRGIRTDAPKVVGGRRPHTGIASSYASRAQAFDDEASPEAASLPSRLGRPRSTPRGSGCAPGRSPRDGIGAYRRDIDDGRGWFLPHAGGVRPIARNLARSQHLDIAKRGEHHRIVEIESQFQLRRAWTVPGVGAVILNRRGRRS